jgi:threonine/homoserine/homoserine lactone efflux protein
MPFEPLLFLNALALGFLIGLTGALAPGPTLVATIQASVKGGWTMGPKVTFGHILVESALVVLTVFGLSVIFSQYTTIIAVIGGIALVVFGILTVRGSRTAVMTVESGDDATTRPVVAGVVTSISNPYFWIWWFTVGSALLVSTMAGGIQNAVAFIIGHWSADLAWLTLVSSGIHKGRFFLGPREYRIILLVCGLFLIGFGLYYTLSAFPGRLA